VGGLLAVGAVTGSGVALLRRLRAAAREVEEAGSRLKVLVEHVPAAVYIDMADPDVSDGGRLAYMSPQVGAILGYRPEELVDDPELWPSRIHPDDREAAIAAYDAHWQTGEPLRAEYRMLAKDGSEVWVRDEAYAMADDASGRRVSQGLLIDTTDRKVLESKLIHDALHDPLTGLANRVLLRDHVEHALTRRERSGGSVALLFVDLDDFKRVNDSYGHAAGDQILVEVATRLLGAVRAEDVVGRQHGDEFAVLVERVGSADEAVLAAARILRELRRPIALGNATIVVGGSIGVALAAEPDATAEELLTQADAAMYAAKASGKDTHAVYDARMPTRTWTELEAAG
jgi:diguanylate cyclase (GGDEF)-like protein/PAS domain S-box-containing protein